MAVLYFHGISLSETAESNDIDWLKYIAICIWESDLLGRATAIRGGLAVKSVDYKRVLYCARIGVVRLYIAKSSIVIVFVI